jgi:hypothetical protein
MVSARFPDPVEEDRLSRGHPYLAASLKPREKRLTALRVEVSCNLVEEENRWLGAPHRDKLCVSKDEPEQKRLLLACRAVCSSHALGLMNDGEIVAMRPLSRPSGRRVPRTVHL